MNETLLWCTTEITIDGETEFITSTPGHKYYLPFNNENRNPDEVLEHANYEELSNKWVSAEDLKAGDKVLLSNGKYGIIIKTEIKKLEEPEVTYNFEVQDFHTYYVGEHGVLCHNACRDPGLDFNKGKSLNKHFNDHGRAMGFETADDYLQGARNFLDGPKAAGMESFTSAQGTYFQYNPLTNEFGIINSYGGISTYFTPNDKLAYWLEQIAKYGP